MSSRRPLANGVAAMAVLSCLGAARAADAQQQTGTVPAPQVERFVLRPSLSVTDMGLDTNVLTTASGQQQDRTANLRAQVEPSLRFGPARLSGTLGARLSYFQVHDRQRSIDADQAARVDVLSRRLSTYALASFVRAHDPFDPEVYTRTRRVQHALESGATYRLTGKTSAGFTAQRSTMSMKAIATELDGDVSQRFGRQTASFTAAVHNALTPLTTVSLLAGVRQEHVETPADSDATSVSLMAGLDTQPDAFIAGKAYAGFRQFRSGGGARRPRRGVVASVDAGVDVADSIRIAALVDRDVSRSFTIAGTYVTSTRLGARLTKQVSVDWTLRAEASRQWLTYDGAVPPAAPDPVRTVPEAAVDSVARYTFAPEYRFGRATSIVFTADYYALQAHASGRRYDRLRLVTSITHRF